MKLCLNFNYTMKQTLSLFMALLVYLALTGVLALAENSFFELSAYDSNQEQVLLSKYSGQVVLVVNTATKCGFTPQLADLETLYRKYQDSGFIVLAFPAEDFVDREPRSTSEILEFCQQNYSTTFPIFSKSSVVGKNKNQVYKFLTENAPAASRGEVNSTFEKFLIARDGTVSQRFGAFTNPLSMVMRNSVEKLLDEKF